MMARNFEDTVKNLLKMPHKPAKGEDDPDRVEGKAQKSEKDMSASF
jgi:hypothetical protein